MKFLFLTAIFLGGVGLIYSRNIVKNPLKSLFPSRERSQGSFLHACREKPRLSKGLRNAISSALATVLVKSILQPLDTVKTVQQSTLSNSGLVATAKELVLTRGPLSLWSGTLVSAFGSAPAAAVYYGIFSSVKARLMTRLPNRLRWIAVAVAATTSNSLASAFRVPYEVYKQRIQVGMHQTIWEAAQYSWKVEGPLGLFQKGKLSAQIIRDVPYAIITAVVYDLLQGIMFKLRALETEKLPTREGKFYQIQDAICGAAAGGLSSFLTTPMDVVKTRLMTSQQYSSLFGAAGKIFREEGIPSFFAGSYSRVLHKVPANALFFVFYEAFRFMTGAVERRSEQ